MDGLSDVPVEDLHEADVTGRVQGPEGVPVHRAVGIAVGVEDGGNHLSLHQGVEQAPDRSDATPRRDEDMLGGAVDQGKLAEGSRQTRLDGGGHLMDQRRDAAGSGHLDAQRDALAFPLDDGKGAPSRPGFQFDFEHDELAGPEGDGAMGRQDGDFDSIFGQTVPWMKHHGSPHRR